jgi:hypothetical protein
MLIVPNQDIQTQGRQPGLAPKPSSFLPATSSYIRLNSIHQPSPRLPPFRPNWRLTPSSPQHSSTRSLSRILSSPEPQSQCECSECYSPPYPYSRAQPHPYSSDPYSCFTNYQVRTFSPGMNFYFTATSSDSTLRRYSRISLRI